MTTPAPRPAVDYSSRDFDSFLGSIIARARIQVPDWQPGDEGDFGMVFAEMVAYVGDVVSYLLDRAASETFLPTAQIRANVVKQAQILGYRPRQQVASVVTLTLTAFDASTATIPAGSQFTTSPELDQVPVIFETDSPISFPGGSPGVDQNLNVTATQGETVAGEAVAVSTGLAAQVYELFRAPVIDSTVEMFVTDNPSAQPRRWSYVDHLVEAGPNDEVFTTDINVQGVTLVAFGNNVTGKVPARGAQIAVNYRVGGGLATNVAAGTITQMVDPVSDIVAVTNQNPATGGQDVEGIESIRANAPFAYAAQNRAFNDDDYKGLALRVPGVGKAKSQSASWQNVVVYIAPANGSDASGALLEQVRDFILDGRALQGVSVRAATAVYVPLDLSVLVEVYDNYSRESVRTAVSNALTILFDFENPYGVSDFGVDVTQGIVYTLVMAVEGVKSCTIQVLAPQGLTTVGDVAISDWQIPQLHTGTVSATGGITPMIPMVDVAGGNPAQPGTAGSPSISLTRCDASTTHVECTWAAATNATLYYLEVQYRDGTGATLQKVTVGGFSVTSAQVDVPKVTNAVALAVRVSAYNGTTGPVYSPTTSTSNPCYTP